MSNMGPNIVRDGMILSLDVANEKSFRGESTVNLVTDTPSKAGWSGTYSVINSITKTFDLQQPYQSNPDAWSTFYWNVSGYIGQYITITADYSFIEEYNATFAWIMMGQGNTGTYPNFLGGSEANDRVYITSKTTQHLTWSGVINAAGLVGFSIWVSNMTSGGYVTCRVSNVQVEQKSYSTPFVNGTRGATVATGGGLLDQSGNNNNGDLINGVLYSSYNKGSLVFDGTNDYVDCGNSTSLDITPNITIETFVNFPSFTSYGGFIAKRTEGPALSNYFFRTGPGIGQFQLGHNPGGAASYQIWATNKTDFTINTWYHIVGVITGTVHKIYVNSVEYSGTWVYGSGYIMATNSTTSLKLGMGYNTGGEPSNVKMSYVKIYNRALSSTEILQNYNATKNRYLQMIFANLTFYLDASISSSVNGVTWTNLKSGGNNGTLTNGPVYTSGDAGYMTFDGTNDFISLTSFDLGTGNVAWTAGAWVKNTLRTGYSYIYQPILSNRSGGPIATSMCINNGNITYWYYFNQWMHQSGSIDVSDGIWHYLTWVQKSNYYMDMYVDGILDVSNIYARAGWNPIDTIGNSCGVTFNGKISSVVIYNAELSQSEILQNYNTSKSRFGL